MTTPSSTEDERSDGFTMVEVLVAMLLLSIVSLMLLSTFSSFARTTVEVQTRSATLNDSRVALETITRDLRAANPIDDVSVAPAIYDRQVSFSVYCSTPGANGCGANRLRSITYRLNTTTRALERVVGTGVRPLVGPTGFTTLPTLERPGAIVNTASEPVFKYYDKDGVQLSTAGTDTGGGTYFRDCTKTVEINLRVRSEPGLESTTDITTRIALRNDNEVTGCDL